MKAFNRVVGLALCCAMNVAAQMPDAGFEVSADWDADAVGRGVRVVLVSQPGHYVYASSWLVETGISNQLSLVGKPSAARTFDPFEAQDVAVYKGTSVFRYAVSPPVPGLELSIRYQGCNESICFMPVVKKLPVGNAELPARVFAPTPPVSEGTGGGVFEGFRIEGRAVGYLDTEEFLEFLDRVEAGRGLESTADLTALLRTRGLWITLLVILVGGLALNLTPCVLPMIPVNLAIIGAGVKAGSRIRGFALGGAYGLGIALAYGLLGVVVRITGSRFGALNASPWFNLAIAILFGVMALSLFGLFSIDLSRFQGGVTMRDSAKGRFGTAFVLGAVSALLAGACVAPVVISVLLLAADLHAAGNRVGVLLPFVLGAGMGLPWPFAGAGLSMLPKPGRWMERVKQVFAVFILVFAIYYGWLGFTLWQAKPTAETHDGWETSLETALATARASGQRVLVDYWASWCKNCIQMDRTTFLDPAVRERLDPYVRVKFAAEDMDHPDVRPVLDAGGVMGLPTYLVLVPEK